MPTDQYDRQMRTGERAPDFELPDQDGEPRRLSALLVDGPVVLFFYPAAMTVGCTKQACHFRDLASEFARAGVQRVGISPDSVDRQRRFADKHALDYPLLADMNGTVAEQYGVRRGRLGAVLGAPVKRWTFAIAADAMIVDAIHSELDFEVHADAALGALTSTG